MMDAVVQDSIFELDNLSAYLSKVRELTRADNEHTILSTRTFDLVATVEKLIRLNNTPADKAVRFETSFSDTSLWVMADPVHIANCLSNLIENAVKYSGNEVCIGIHASLEDNRLSLKIKDNGIGIPLQEQERVFEKFYRAQNIPDANLPGIGLGLSYVKLMVEAHGGSITLQSQPGKGTTFTIEIPQ
jgi:two-component system phosphate regulon sensor histidine kinase PhoR